MNEKRTPKANPNELKKLDDQFKEFDSNIKEMTLDRMNAAPKKETEPQVKLSQNEIAQKPEIYLKPSKTIGTPQKFNEKFRDAYNFDKEYVQFMAENNEIKGETIEIWTRPYGGMAAEFWQVPVGKPVWGPRYLAEQIKRKFYHRLTMDNKVTSQDGAGQYYGQVAVDTTIQRLDARPVSTRKSVFMGAVNF